MGLGIPALQIKIMLESNPLKSIMLARRLAVEGSTSADRLAAGRDQAGLRSPKAGGSDRNRNVLEPETSPGRTTENTTESPPRTRGTRSIRKQLALLSMKSESESPQECVVSEAAFEAAGAHLARTLCFGL